MLTRLKHTRTFLHNFVPYTQLDCSQIGPVTYVSVHCIGILHCKCVRQLMPHLARRQVVAASVSTYILSQADSEAAGSLEKLLNGRSREPASEASMVEGTLLYLTAMRSLEMCGVTVWLSADLDLLVCIYPYLALLPIFTTSLQCEGSYSCWI